MERETFDRVQALFLRAIDLPDPQRLPMLRAECGDDEALLTAVLTMLEEDGRTSLLDSTVAEVAGSILTDAAGIVSVGPYRLEQPLGEGGMGVVYLARRTDLGTRAAVKILKDSWLSPARRERFAEEQRTLARLNHPSIARLYDAGAFTDGTPWIVMEYVDGMPLTQYCRERAMPIRDRLQLLRAVADAVQYAHRHLIVHRDLKPNNVLVTGDGTVKLLDFGIAKQLRELSSPADTTRTLLRAMTPAYAAPEQIRGDNTGLHTDVYGLGAILYELLTGGPPFDFTDASHAESERMILQDEPKRPSLVATRSSAAAPDAASVSRSAWADLDVLCLTALHKEPSRRYPTVEAFTRDIDHYLNGEPLEARPDSVGYRTRKFVTRNRQPIGVAAVVVLVVAGLVTFYTVRLARAGATARTEATRAQRVQELMQNILTGGEQGGSAPAENLRVVDVLRRGALEAETLSAEPIVQAELFKTLGGLYGELGELDEAEALSVKALDRNRALFGADSVQAARSLVSLGRVRMAQSKYEEADKLIRGALDIEKRRLPPDDVEIATTTTALGEVLEERGEYAEAIKVLEQAVQLHSARTSASVDLARSLRHLGNVHFYAGHYDQADEIFHRVLEMTRAVNGERHALVGDDMINIGAVRFERGLNEEAEQWYRKALPIMEEWYGKDDHHTASNLTMLGRTLVRQKRYDEAVPILERALAIQERVFGRVHPAVASAVNELGNVAVRRERYDEADAAFRRMADIYRAVYPGKHFLTGVAIANLGGVFAAKREYQRAEALFREAIDIFSQTQGPAHLNTGIARIRLGRALLGERRYAEAERETLIGYEIVSKQASPTFVYLQNAREDLVKVYAALGQPAKAARFQTELSTPPAVNAKTP